MTEPTSGIFYQNSAFLSACHFRPNQMYTFPFYCGNHHGAAPHEDLMNKLKRYTTRKACVWHAPYYLLTCLLPA